MSRNSRKTIGLACLALAAILVVPAGVATAAEQPSAAQIIKALKPTGLKRGLAGVTSDNALTVEEARFIDSLRNRKTRSLSTEDREQVASIAKNKPSIDLEINFEYDSATLGPRAMAQVTALGQALTSGELAGRTFVVAGHTDAKGADAYNQSLSEQRADAVKRFLTEKYNIATANLVTVGHGKTQLKNAADPFSGDNRRVQVINMSEK
jgi:outer membrane protein OmpA-like peptidoglycan-associated protein